MIPTDQPAQYVAPTGPVTGAQLAPGTRSNQVLALVNEGGFPIAMHTSPGTSLVADSASAPVLPPNCTRTYQWDTGTGRWYAQSQSQTLVCNVRDFGATGDGTTDDTIAIQTAITAATTAGGGTVFLPPGTYLHATDISVPSNMIIAGAGASSILLIAAGSSANGLLVTGATNVIVRDLQVNANKASTNNTGTQYTTVNGIRVYNSSYVLIENCVTHDAYYGGILLDTATDCLVRNCKSYNNRDNAVFIRPACVNITVEGCHCSGSTYSGIQAIHSDYITFQGNISYNNGPAPSTEGDGLGFEGCRWSSMIGNITYGNSTQGIKVDYTVEGTPEPQNSSHILLEGNHIYNNGITETDSGIAVLRSDYVSIIGNYVYGNYYGMNIGQVTRTNIRGNHVVANTQQGIRQYSTSATGPLSISNNRIEENGSHGIEVQIVSSIRENLIKGNTNEGIRLTSGSNHLIAGNTLLDNTDNGILVASGSNHEVRDNYFTNTASAQARALFENSGQGPTRMVNNRITSQSNSPYHFDHANSRSYDEQSAGNVTVTSAYTIVANDEIILCNQSAAITITLTTTANTAGRLITIKDKSGTGAANPITITPNGAQKIDGASSATITTNYGVLRLVSDGANWFTV